MRLAYEQVEPNQTEVQRRVEAAFDVLFEEIFTLSSGSTNLRQNEGLKVITQHRLSKFWVSEIGC
jgi:hypothetical protein